MNTFIESLNRQGRGVRVEFHKLPDRYAHRVYVVDRESSSLALESCEAESEDLQTSTFQDLNIQAGSTSDFAALVGMSGASHWSLTVEPQLADERPQLVFDAACRMKVALSAARTAYQLGAEASLDPIEDAMIVATPLGKLQLTANVPDASAVAALSSRERQIILQREVARPDTLPATVRWRYELQLLA